MAPGTCFTKSFAVTPSRPSLMTRIKSPRALLLAFVLVVGVLVAAATVPAAVWPDQYPPAVGAGLAVVVAVAAVALLAVRLRRWMVERSEVAGELDALRAASKDAIVGVDPEGTIVSWSAGA